MYGLRVSRAIQEKELRPSLRLGVVAIKKGSLRVTFDDGLLTYIYMCVCVCVCVIYNPMTMVIDV